MSATNKKTIKCYIGHDENGYCFMRLPEDGRPRISGYTFTIDKDDDEDVKNMLSPEQKQSLIEILNEHVFIEDSSFLHDCQPNFEKENCRWLEFDFVTETNYIIISKQGDTQGRYCPNTNPRDFQGAS